MQMKNILQTILIDNFVCGFWQNQYKSHVGWFSRHPYYNSVVFPITLSVNSNINFLQRIRNKSSASVSNNTFLLLLPSFTMDLWQTRRIDSSLIATLFPYTYCLNFSSFFTEKQHNLKIIMLKQCFFAFNLISIKRHDQSQFAIYFVPLSDFQSSVLINLNAIYFIITIADFVPGGGCIVSPSIQCSHHLRPS